MKLSISAYRASANNVNRRLSSNARQQYAATANMSRSLSWGSTSQNEPPFDSNPSSPPPVAATSGASSPFGGAAGNNTVVTAGGAGAGAGGNPETSQANASTDTDKQEGEEEEEKKALLEVEKKAEQPRPPRSRGTQRWMKLRTTVQLSGAVASAVAKKPPLKREDSFLKRFSTRQIAEASSDTVDAEASSGDDSSGHPKGTRHHHRRRRRKCGRGLAGRHYDEEPVTVVNPDENFYFGWLSLLTVCVLYNCWTLIVRQAFPELQSSLPPLWYAADGFSDLVFLADVVVQLRTGYLEQGLMVYDSRKLALHYVRSRAFLLDLASLLPLDLIPLCLGSAMPMVRFPRFLKLYRSYKYYYMVESRTLYPNLWRVVNLIHILLLLAHWFGCFYYLLSEAEGFRGEWSYPNPEKPNFEAFATLTRRYLGSLYWSTLTLTTIGGLPTPESDWERRRLASIRGETDTLPVPFREFPAAVAVLASTTPAPAAGNVAVVPAGTSSLVIPTTSAPAPAPDTSSSSSPTTTTTTSSSSTSSGITTPGSIAVHPTRRLRSRLLYIATDRGYLFTIVSYLIGVFIFATIVGQVGNVITNRNASRLEFERLLDGAKLYMRQHKVPREMQRRVQRWYDYSWSRGRMQGGGDINSALGILPDKLKTELALHVNLYTLKKVSIFQECQPEFLHDLVLKMRAYIFTPGDLICRKGEVAREMFIIADGILEVIGEAGRVLTTMRAGDFFGEIGILNLDGLNKRTADVRSVGYAELFSLSRGDVLAAMKDYPEAQDILQSLGRKRLMEAKLAAAGLKRDTDSDSHKGSSSGGKESSTGNGESAKSRAVQMVRKLKRDARGLRNYLRRGGRSESRSEHKKTEASVRIEMEPITPLTGGTPAGEGEGSEQVPPAPGPEVEPREIPFRRFLWGKKQTSLDDGHQSKFGKTLTSKTGGILMRMQRVGSLGEPPSSPPTPCKKVTMQEPPHPESSDPPDQPLGAGLPLLQRLLMLKEREDRQAREAQAQAQGMQQAQSREVLSQDVQSNEVQGQSQPQSGPPIEPLGAGLPLLKRIKLLREKEEREKKQEERERKHEERERKHEERANQQASKEKTAEIILDVVGTSCQLSPPPEPIGAGLPLLQRLKLLREREEQERLEQERQAAAVAAATNSTKMTLAKALLLKRLETLKEEEKSLDRSRSFLEDEAQLSKEYLSLYAPIQEGPIPISTCDTPTVATDTSAKVSVTAMLHTAAVSPVIGTETSPRKVPSAPVATPSASTAMPMLLPSDKRSRQPPLNRRPIGGWQAFKGIMKPQDVSAAIPPVTSTPSTTPHPPSSPYERKASEGLTVIYDPMKNKMATVSEMPIVTAIAVVPPSEPAFVTMAPMETASDTSTVSPAVFDGNQLHSLVAPPPTQLPMDFKPEEYLADLLVGVKQVLQSRLEDIQDQFKSRLVTLEEEVRRKDLVIKQLEETLRRCEVYTECGRSLSPIQRPTSVTLPEGSHHSEEEKQISSSGSAVTSDSKVDEGDDFFDDDFEEASDVTHPGYVSHPRRSWPLLPPWSERHRTGAPQRAWESQAALAIDPEQMWRVEFPVEGGGPQGRHWQGQEPPPEGHASEGDSTGSGSNLDTEDVEERLKATDHRNDWEIQMLAEQMLQTETDASRHSDKGDESDTSHDEGLLESPEHTQQVPQVKLERRSSLREKRTFTSEGDGSTSGVHIPPLRGRTRSLDIGSGRLLGSLSPLLVETVQEEEEEVAGEVKEPELEIPQITEPHEGASSEKCENLLGVLQQLSPTERRELERLLEVATRRHLTRQLSLQPPMPIRDGSLGGAGRHHSVAEGPSSPGSPASPASSNCLPRRTYNHHGGGSEQLSLSTTPPCAYVRPIPAAEGEASGGHGESSQSGFEHDTGRRPPTLATVPVPPTTLVSPPAEDDSVSICIPEYEPLLGPK